VKSLRGDLFGPLFLFGSFEKIYYKDFLHEIVENYDCDFYITYKNGKFISTIHYPIHRNAIGWIVYLS